MQLPATFHCAAHLLEHLQPCWLFYKALKWEPPTECIKARITSQHDYCERFKAPPADTLIPYLLFFLAAGEKRSCV